MNDKAKQALADYRVKVASGTKYRDWETCSLKPTREVR